MVDSSWKNVPCVPRKEHWECRDLDSQAEVQFPSLKKAVGGGTWLPQLWGHFEGIAVRCRKASSEISLYWLKCSRFVRLPPQLSSSHSELSCCVLSAAHKTAFGQGLDDGSVISQP